MLERKTGFALGRFVGQLSAAQVLITWLTSSLTSLGFRPVITIMTSVILTIALTVYNNDSRLNKVIGSLVSATIFGMMIFIVRRYIDSFAFCGPVPAIFELPAVTAIVTLNVIFAAPVTLSRAQETSSFKLLLLYVALSTCFFAGAWAYLNSINTQSTIAQRIRRITELESALSTSTPFERQELSFLLDAFGRSKESRAFSTRTLQPLGRTESVQVPKERPLLPNIVSGVNWRQALQEIAVHNRVVIVMEAHNATEHRAWIEEALPIFCEAGFKAYAAEALFESGDTIKRRGFPADSSGYYVGDPRFGNILRRAISLDMRLFPYEAHFVSTPAEREEVQARTLAKILSTGNEEKLLIHAGFSHVFKSPQPGFGRWMAARLWERTGIEPYCIYQSYGQFDSENYEQIVDLAGAEKEPKMLIPPPRGLIDSQFADIPDGAVDAVVVHPSPVSNTPATRESLNSGKVRIAGQWLGSVWPVVIGAYNRGESDNAIPLDQIMLRSGETDFVLWATQADSDLRVTSLTGLIETSAEVRSGALVLREAHHGK